MTDADNRILSYGVAGSLAMHVLLFCAFAVSIVPVKKVPRPMPEPEPVVTMVFPQDIQVTPLQKIPEPKPTTEPQRYIRTTQNEDASVAPTKADFVSDRNTVASAKLAPDPAGVAAMPTLNGVNIPTTELANREYKDGQIKNDSELPPPPLPKPEALPSAPPQKLAQKNEASVSKEIAEIGPSPKIENPETKPQEIRRAVETPEPLPEMKTPDELPAPKALAMSAPPLPSTAHSEKDSFVPQTRTSAAKGTLSNHGNEDAVNATATATGRYTRQVTSAIEKKWNQHRVQKADFVEPGKLRLHFFVDKKGKISAGDVSIVFNEANAVLTDFTISSILEAEIPPIPQDLLTTLDKERFEIEYDVVVY